MTKKFYPSSSAFMLGDVVMTKYDSGCLRSILAKANGIRTGEIHPVYKRVGAAHEDAYAELLSQDDKNISIEREVQVKKEISLDVQYSGRMDFRVLRALPDGTHETIIHETKGTVSKNTRRDFRKGEYNVSYLAQLVSYMVDERTTKGKLVCGYYEEDDSGVLRMQETREYRVTVTDTGRLDVDGEPSGYNVADLLAHRRAAAAVLENHEVGPRPDKWNQKWGGPCGRCAFSKTCDAWDSGALGTDTAMFLGSAEEDAAVARATVQADPIINKVKAIKVKAVKGKKSTKGDTQDG
jgi:hypothetical protein